MAQYYENGPVHSAPRPAPTVAGGHRASRSVARMDCDDCPIAGTGCGDCMVALLGPVRFRLDAPEQRAVEELHRHGLVSAEEVAGAYATPDLPDWVAASWSPEQLESDPAERLRAIG
ncbi:MAG: hypothetical protein GX344_04430 [Intrasporangiaceae bacterium]|nr:hypothetical protein [Intrasporangiaceae bacterium]